MSFESVVRYSPLCDVDLSAYLAYCYSNGFGTTGVYSGPGVAGDGGEVLGTGLVGVGGCVAVGSDPGFSAWKARLEAVGRVVDESGGARDGDRRICDAGSSSADGCGVVGGGRSGVVESCDVDSGEPLLACLSSIARPAGGVGGAGLLPRGPNFARNQASRERKKKAKLAASVKRSSGRVTARSGGGATPLGGEPSLAGSSGVETVVTTASEAEERTAMESELRRSLAARRLAENKVATLKAERLALSLMDEDKCRAYDDVKALRLVQWSNQARSSSQKSWRECQRNAGKVGSAGSGVGKVGLFEAAGQVSSAGSAGEYFYKKAMHEAEPKLKAYDALTAGIRTIIAGIGDAGVRRECEDGVLALLQKVDDEVDYVPYEEKYGEDPVYSDSAREALYETGAFDDY